MSEHAFRAICASLFITLFGVLPTGQSAFAYELEPIVVQLASSGNGSVQSMAITNTHDVPIAIEVSVYRRSQKPDGSEDRAEELDDVLVSPPQMVIAPGASQSFKVRYVGSPDVTQELTYRVVTEQLPISLREERRNDFSAKVSMRYRYEAALYIVPSKREPVFRLLSAEPISDDTGKYVQLDIASEGNMRAILQQPSLTLSAGGASAVLTGESVKELEGLNILAGNHRIVRLPWPESLPFGPVEGALDAQLLILQ